MKSPITARGFGAAAAIRPSPARAPPPPPRCARDCELGARDCELVALARSCAEIALVSRLRCGGGALEEYDVAGGSTIARSNIDHAACSMAASSSIAADDDAPPPRGRFDLCGGRFDLGGGRFDLGAWSTSVAALSILCEAPTPRKPSAMSFRWAAAICGWGYARRSSESSVRHSASASAAGEFRCGAG